MWDGDCAGFGCLQVASRLRLPHVVNKVARRSEQLVRISAIVQTNAIARNEAMAPLSPATADDSSSSDDAVALGQLCRATLT